MWEKNSMFLKAPRYKNIFEVSFDLMEISLQLYKEKMALPQLALVSNSSLKKDPFCSFDLIK